MPTSLTADKSPYTAKRYTMQLSPKVHSVTIQNWRIDYHVSFPYLRAKLKT